MYQVNKKRNDLRREQNKYRLIEDNYKNSIDKEYQNNLARNEYLKNKENEEKKRMKENYEKQERETEKKNIIKNNINEFNRFLFDNHAKSNLNKKKKEHEHQITLQKIEDKYNLYMQHLDNGQDEKIKQLNSEEIINNKKAENKIFELNLERKKVDNKTEKNKKIIENSNEEEMMKKKN